jgi:hypothetical protein
MLDGIPAEAPCDSSACIEVRPHPDEPIVTLRSTELGGFLAVTAQEFAGFVARCKAGDLDAVAGAHRGADPAGRGPADG